MTQHYPQATILSYKNMVPKISPKAFIAPGVTIIGNVTIGDYSNIWFGSVIRGDVNHITIGNNVTIQDGTVIHVASYGSPTIIEDNVSIGHQALIHACYLKKNSYVGMRACVMDDAIINEYAMVGAGSMITKKKNIPSHELWIGVPAKKLRDINKEDRALIEWTPRHYATIAQEYKNNSHIV